MAHSFGQTYGRWEFRARTDHGRGLGSAILLWPDSEKLPIDGEIDIAEVPAEQRDKAHFVSTSRSEGSDTIVGGNMPGDFSQWHTFAVDWLPDRITCYVDGRARFRSPTVNIIPDTPMHLTIQFDQGPGEGLDARARTPPRRQRSRCRSTGCACTPAPASTRRGA